jgi:hypothetical protein
MSDQDFTKIASKLLLDIRDLVDWGVEGGHTTQEQLRLTVGARRQSVKELAAKGLSLRRIADITGLSKTQVDRDLNGRPHQGERKLSPKGTEIVPKGDRDRFQGDEEPGIEDEIDPENYCKAFLIRADQAALFAVYSGEVSQEVIEAAEAAASAWQNLVGQLRRAKR